MVALPRASPVNRRGARSTALNVLYEVEVSGAQPGMVLARYAGNDGYDFASELVEGVCAHQEELDAILARYARDWSVERMPLLDRSVLRIALFEMQYRPDIPAAVSINEAVELAKNYSTDDSSRFVNGLLSAALSGLKDEEVGPTA